MDFRNHLSTRSVKKECIPVGCVPPAHWAYLVVSAMHAPPAMHAYPPCTPPCHACPPATHASPCHAYPPAMHAPTVDRILDTRFWKYYLAPTSLRAVKRMHSSRMCIVRSSSHVYPSMHWALCIPACTGQGGVCPGGGVSQHALRQKPPPLDRITDRCKKHNLRKLRLRTVKRYILYQFFCPQFNWKQPHLNRRRFYFEYLKPEKLPDLSDRS